MVEQNGFQVVDDEVVEAGEGSTRRMTARLPVPGGWLYRTELSLVMPDADVHLARCELALSTIFVPETDENVPRGTE